MKRIINIKISLILIFVLFYSFLPKIILGKNRLMIKGIVMEKRDNEIKIKDFKTKRILNIKVDKKIENTLKKGDIVKFFFNNNGEVNDFRKIDMIRIRNRIKRLRDFRMHKGFFRRGGLHHGGGRR